MATMAQQGLAHVAPTAMVAIAGERTVKQTHLLVKTARVVSRMVMSGDQLTRMALAAALAAAVAAAVAAMEMASSCLMEKGMLPLGELVAAEAMEKVLVVLRAAAAKRSAAWAAHKIHERQPQ